jgi:anti-sigma factor RsiW
MTCSFDLKEYALGEASREDAARIESHVPQCDGCREELARLQLTHTTLLALRDEELPRRIAFVSDKVFEPGWFQRLWNSGPRLGFLAAALLAFAILVHGFAIRPATSPAAVAAIDTQAIEQRIAREVSARLDAAVQTAVTEAVADSEARQQKKTAELLQAAERRTELDRRATIEAFTEQTRLLQKQVSSMYITAHNMRSGE